jgi:ADP-ribosylglycohydrolase
MDEAFDVGNQTRGALSGLADGDRSAGREYWRRNDHRPAGNGSLMRTAPIGVAYASRPPEALVDAAIAESLITHADPRCLLACAGFDAAIAAGVRDGADALAMRRAAQSGMHLATQSLRAAWQDEERIERELLINGRMELELDLAAAVAPDPHGYSDLHAHLSGGFVRVAFRIAFWHLVNTPSWRDAVVDVASRGGDADTNAAITGALLGARDGENAIPEEWRLRVLSATQPGSPGWADAHHPRHFLTLVK